MRSIKRKIALLLTFALIVMCVSACGANEKTEAQARTIVDMSGNTIELPDEIDKYAVAWAGLTDILLMFDGTEHLVAYPEKSGSFKWIFSVYPEYESKTCLADAGVSTETVLETGAQVVFLKAADDEELYNRLRECGVAAIDCKFDTYEELETVVNMIAEVLGTENAADLANKYCNYLDQAVADTVAFSVTLSAEARVSALVMKNTKDYSAYGSSRYTGKWVEMCGGNYSMVNEDAYANVNLTQEQIIEYNPDYIFFAMPNQATGFIENPVWEELSAVKNGHVYNIPSGFNTWSNCGAESALVFRWAAYIMYPEQTSFDIDQEIKSFYSQFYGYEPSDEEIERILLSSF